MELAADPMPSRATWRITPRYKYRHDGDRVVYKDEILILNNKYNAYLHFSTYRESEIPNKEYVKDVSNHEEFWLRSLFRRRDPATLFTCYESNASQNSEEWQIRKYRTTYTISMEVMLSS
jgi:signal peptidase I